MWSWAINQTNLCYRGILRDLFRKHTASNVNIQRAALERAYSQEGRDAGKGHSINTIADYQLPQIHGL